MKGHPTEALLDDYLAGDLDEDRNAVFEQHLNTCARCSREVERSRALMSDLRALPLELSPQRDLRPRRPAETAAALASHRVRFTPRRVGSAAAGLAVLLMGSWAWSSLRGSNDPAELDLASLPALQREAAALAGQLRTYETASRRLSGELERHRSRLAAPADSLVASSLARIDRAIERTAQTVREFPEDLVVKRMLLGRYEGRIDLVRRTLDMEGDEW